MNINYLAIFVSSVAAMILGSFWYSPVGFGRAWVELSGIEMHQMDKSIAKKGYLVTFISILARAFALAWLVAFTGASTWGAGLRLGCWIGLGVVATTMIPNYYFTQRPRRLYLIDAGLSFAAVLLTTVILAVW